jgi:hypothetical protein
MANYPGTSTGIRWDVDIGEDNLWASIGQLAKTGMDIELQRNALQAETELQDAILKAEDEMLQLADRLRENEDESTYQSQLDQSIGTMNTFMPKNRLAAQGYSAWIKDQTPGWKKKVNESMVLRLTAKWDATRKTLAAKALETGSMTPLRIHMQTGIATGQVTQEESDEFLRQTAHGVEVEAAKRYAMRFPDEALKSIKADKMEGFVALTPDDIEAVRGTANRALYQDSKALEAAQDKAGREMIVALWNGELTDLQDVTNALDKNLITPTMAKYLRESILSPKDATPAEALRAETEVRNDLDRYQLGEITKHEALESLYKNADALGKEKGSSLLSKIYEEPDKALAEMKREGKSLMEEYIRTKEPISGLFSDNKQEIMMTAEAQLLLDLAIEEAAKRKKPMGRRDIMIEAMRIGKAQREKLDRMGEEETISVPTHLGTIPAKPLRKPESVPLSETLGLEDIWDELNKEERQSAVHLLAQGATAAQLIAHYKKAK